MRRYAKELHELGFDIGDYCRKCIEDFGDPVCDDSGEPGGSECGMLEELNGLLLQAGIKGVKT